MKILLKHTKIGLISIFAVGFLSGCSEIQFLTQASKTISDDKSSKQFEGPVLSGSENGANGTHYKVGKAYKIKGTWYYPKENYSYVEQGVASWYGPNFHGKLTANGATFDMNSVSAAHKTLPLPSIVRVTNLENGRSLKVKVNDRGPYAHDRIIDMSKKAAELLGFRIQGTALVKVEVLESESRLLAEYMRTGKMRNDQPPAPSAAPTVAISSETLEIEEGVVSSEPSSVNHDISKPTSTASIEREPLKVPESDTKVEKVALTSVPGIFVQAGAFSKYANAVKTQARLSSVGDVVIQQINKGETPLFRVRVGPIVDVARADNIQTAIVNAGYPDARIVVEAK